MFLALSFVLFIAIMYQYAPQHQQPLKRAKSDGTEPVDVTTAEARARMDRAFTMPQFVTSVAGYGGSARAKQVRLGFWVFGVFVS